MKTESLSLILLIISFQCQILSTFFQSVFDLGPRTTECTAWSWWSPCFSTKDPSFWFRMPGYCDFNPYGRQLRNNGVLTAIESSYGYLKKLNDTKTPCGQCLYQISCSYRCRGFNNGLTA
uniref:Uncharacterized protein n=1 Tax=Romanomermis culicivorax TaxID=13658 RepID=A0A915IL37_ROMCU